MAGAPDQYFNPSPNATLTPVAEYVKNPIATAFIGIVLILIVTRAASSRNTRLSPTDKHGVDSVPTVPYWLPYFGHMPNMALDANFLRRLRSRFPDSPFAIFLGGRKWNIVYHPSLTTQVLNQKGSVANFEDISNRFMRSIFGFPAAEWAKYEAAYPELVDCYKHLLSEPSLGSLVTQTAQRLRHDHLKDLVTGNESEVDQTPWERTSHVTFATTATGEPVVEASLLPLIRNFVAFTAIPSLMGSDFLSNFPDFIEHLWTLDQGFLLLAAGLPRWLPIPALTRAHIARKNLLEMLRTFHEAMEKDANGAYAGSKWSSLDDVGPLVKARMVVYRKHGFSIEARAAVEHSLMWAASANSNPLIFWMINRIYADRALLEMIREEIQPYVQAVEIPSELPISEPPRLERFDVEGLCTNCPLLKSCYVECMRMDTAIWNLRILKEDVMLRSREKGAPEHGWLLRKGEYVQATQDLHNTDPSSFPHPEVWTADRHVKDDGEEKTRMADLGTLRPYGGGGNMCKGRSFAVKEIMMFTAAILAMWDIEPAGRGDWKMPRHQKATGTYTTNDDTRVWVQRRRLDRLDEKRLAA